MANFQLVGVAKVTAAISRLAQTMPVAAAQALNEVAELTMTSSKEQTPVEFGVLKASGKVDRATAADLKATLSYGTEYALIVHENLNARHAPGTNAKYLENAVNKAAGTFSRDIADALKDRL